MKNTSALSRLSLFIHWLDSSLYWLHFPLHLHAYTPYQSRLTRLTTQSFASLGVHLLVCFHLRPGSWLSDFFFRRRTASRRQTTRSSNKEKKLLLLWEMLTLLKDPSFLSQPSRPIGSATSSRPHSVMGTPPETKTLPVLLFTVWSAIIVSFF